MSDQVYMREIYNIRSENSGLLLDVPGFSAGLGTKIQQWSRTDGANQMWRFHHRVDSGYEIVSANSELVLDVPGASKAPGAQIQQWSPVGGANQQWLIKAVQATTYEIIAVDSGLVLDVPGASKDPGTVIQQWPEHGGPNQQWEFELGGLGHQLISRTGQHHQEGGYITISGERCTPNVKLKIYYMGVPNAHPILEAKELTVGADGTFSVTDTVYITSRNRDDNFKFVTVVTEGPDGNLVWIDNINASYWVG